MLFLNPPRPLDPIEGIWHLSGKWITRDGRAGSWDSKVAIVRDTVQPGRDFVEVYLEPDRQFPLYAVTAHFARAAAPYVYISKQFGPDGSFSYVTLSLTDGDQLVGVREETREGLSWRMEWRYIRLEPRRGAGRAQARGATVATGFLVNRSGVVATNQHVIEGASGIEVVVPWRQARYGARVLAQDRHNDLALLQLEAFDYAAVFREPIPFRIGSGERVALGEEVFTLGFPLSDLLGSAPRLSVGKISSLYGIEDDPRVFQISNPVQPGNSGGPLFNSTLELIGVVVATLDASYLFERARILPQNVNFAVKAAYLEALLRLAGVGWEEGGGRRPLPLERAVEAVAPFVVQVRALR